GRAGNRPAARARRRVRQLRPAADRSGGPYADRLRRRTSAGDSLHLPRAPGGTVPAPRHHAAAAAGACPAPGTPPRGLSGRSTEAVASPLLAIDVFLRQVVAQPSPPGVEGVPIRIV